MIVEGIAPQCPLAARSASRRPLTVPLTLPLTRLSPAHACGTGSHLAPETMVDLQSLGYTAWRLDEHDGRRFISRSGWDHFSPPGTIGRLDRMAAAHNAIDRQITK